jgi:hypothetical protein
MEYKSNSDTKTFDYSMLRNYGQAKCGVGVTAPAFKVYPFGSHFAKNTRPLTLCDKHPVGSIHVSREYRDQPFSTLDEFGKMMRTKNTY